MRAGHRGNLFTRTGPPLYETRLGRTIVGFAYTAPAKPPPPRARVLRHRGGKSSTHPSARASPFSPVAYLVIFPLHVLAAARPGQASKRPVINVASPRAIPAARVIRTTNHERASGAIIADWFGCPSGLAAARYGVCGTSGLPPGNLSL